MNPREDSMTNFKMFFAMFLLASLCVASPVYDLGLPCGPNSVVGCLYNNFNTSTTTTSGSGSMFYSEPGRTLESRWQSATKNQNDNNEYAGTESSGWWQGIANFGLAETSSFSFSDDYRYGSGNGVDWWEDYFSSGSYYSLGQWGSGVSLWSDWTTITLTTWAWGNSSESWDNFFKNAGGANWLGGSSSFNNTSWASGGSGSSWSNFSQESYPDPSFNAGAVPEPLNLFLTGGGLVLLGLFRCRLSRAS